MASGDRLAVPGSAGSFSVGFSTVLTPSDLQEIWDRFLKTVLLLLLYESLKRDFLDLSSEDWDFKPAAESSDFLEAESSSKLHALPVCLFFPRFLAFLSLPLLLLLLSYLLLPLCLLPELFLLASTASTFTISASRSSG